MNEELKPWERPFDYYPPKEHKEPETIFAAALLFNGIVYTLPRPKRHHDILKFISEDPKLDLYNQRGTQGFLTSSGRFVSRTRARIIAVNRNQIIREGTIHPTLLFSEDVW